jgi:macrolide transport system ATP-binding/permease protein
MNQDEAYRAARRTYGNVEQAKQAHRDERSILWLEQLVQDTRYTMRQFRKSPGFAITVILTIALGIGANTAIFTLIHSILLKSLPVTNPGSLYRVGDTYSDCCFTSGLDNANGDFDIFSWENYRHLRASTSEFEQLAAMQAGPSSLSVRRGPDPAQSKLGEFVSGNYFSTFGISAFAGRVFTDTDDQKAASPVAVMSYQA